MEFTTKIKLIPFFTLIAAILIALSLIMATQYVTIRHVISAEVTIREAFICPLARERSITVGDWVINASSATQPRLYFIKYGKWIPGTNITFTCAFALVNNNSLPVRTTCYVTGSAANYVNVTLHEQPAKTCNETIANQFGVTAEESEDKETLWASGGVGQTGEAWDIGPWQGYGEAYNPALGRYRGVNYSATAPDGSYYFTPGWDTDEYVHYYDSADEGVEPSDGTAASNYGVREHEPGGTADDWGSNYVWVEITFGIPVDANIGDITVQINFYFQMWNSTAAV